VSADDPTGVAGSPVRRLILASTSPYRRALLARLGLPFEAVSPIGVDEDLAKREEPTPEAIARRLAREKAESLRARFPDAVIIGGDQVGSLPDPATPRGFAILDKPLAEERAVEQLLAAAGREARLVTAMCVLDAARGALDEALDEHRLGFRELTRGEALDYVRRDRPLDCAGAFRLEGLGAALFRYVRGDDPTAVVGLPVMRLTAILAARGLRVLGPVA
jgi:MAF protein